MICTDYSLISASFICSRIVTGGSDGDVHVWNSQGIGEEDAESHKIGDCVHALAVTVSVLHLFDIVLNRLIWERQKKSLKHGW